MTLTTIYSNISPQSKREQRGHLDWRRNRQECSIRMIALCAVVDVAKVKGAREPWSMKPCVDRAAGCAWGAVEWSWTHRRASWTNGARGRAGDEDGDTIVTVVEEDDAEELIRTVKDETSHRVCQTRDNSGRTRAPVLPIPRGRDRRPP
uniref:Uncharacterized protein n=1 Tax=Oryza glumipatula TaxID=40148 RepID=A0A0E0B574_9ORYZ